MTRGNFSNWLKIDLHIHTDLSRRTKENDYSGDFSVELLHDKLIENNVEIFSLTDHNIINIEAYRKYYESYSSGTDPLLLLGIELDIFRAGDTYHSLLIFNYSSINKVEEISVKLEDKYNAKNQEYKRRSLTIDEIVELFPDDEFFFIPHAGNERSIVAIYRNNIKYAQKMVLLMHSALEKVPAKAKQKYNDGFDQVLNDAFKSQDDIAYINFSDNHKISEYPCINKGLDDPRNHEFYFIKGGKNFETLRLAFIDPKSRIKSHEEILEINPNLNVIEKIKIENDQIISNCELNFSPHLNVIIGGRSSGKSLLMSIFGKKIDTISYPYDKYKIDYSNILIKSRLDDNYKAKTSSYKDILFINQGDIVRYFEEQKLEDLASKSGKADEYKVAKEKYNDHKISFSQKVNELKASYTQAYDSMRNTKFILHDSILEKILNKELIFKIDYKKLMEFHDKSAEIASDSELIQRIQQNLEDLNNFNIIGFDENEKTIIKNFETLILSKSNLIESKIKLNRNKLNFLTSVKKEMEIVKNSLTSAAREKIDSENNLHKLLENISERFVLMKDLKDKCDNFEKFDYSHKEEVKLSDDTILILEVEKNEELKNIVLDGINKVNNENSLFLNILALLENKSSVKIYQNNQPESFSKKIDSYLTDFIENLDKPKDYLAYNDGSSSKDNSPGLNSEKYLEIILKNPNNEIIIIDQPEDNLGNKFIATNMVQLLRELKFQKQIILVTHNPAIVVYGDAESIIVADNNNNIISYKQIVLEEKDAQKEICGILDGGEYIFNNRAQKYNIQRILN